MGLEEVSGGHGLSAARIWSWSNWKFAARTPAGSYPDKQLHYDGVALGGSHVQRRAVHLGPGVTAYPGSKKHVGRRVVAMLGSEVQGGRP